jgi:hypothetical protein
VIDAGTAPGESVADSVQIWVEDQAAGNAALKIRTEDGSVVTLYRQAHIADVSTAHATSTYAQVNTALNALGATINTILQRLENLGLSATS